MAQGTRNGKAKVAAIAASASLLAALGLSGGAALADEPSGAAAMPVVNDRAAETSVASETAPADGAVDEVQGGQEGSPQSAPATTAAETGEASTTPDEPGATGEDAQDSDPEELAAQDEGVQSSGAEGSSAQDENDSRANAQASTQQGDSDKITDSEGNTFDRADYGTIDLASLTIKPVYATTGEPVDLPTLYTATYDGTSHGDFTDQDSLFMRWVVDTVGGQKVLYSAYDGNGTRVIKQVPYYSAPSKVKPANGVRTTMIGFEIYNSNVESGPGDASSANYDDIMTTPGTIYVRFTAGSPIDPVGKYYGNSAWIPVMTIEAKPVTLAWAGTADRKPGDGGSVTAALPEGAVVAGDDVRLVVDGGGEQAEGRYTATARLEGADAFKYSLQNASQPYVVGNPAPEPEPETPKPQSETPTNPAPKSDEEPKQASDKKTDDSSDKALPQTGDATPAAGIAVAGVTGVVTVLIGFLRRREA